MPLEDAGTRNEHVYYKWCSAGKDMVPGFATSIEGSSALLLSPDESDILLVLEYGRFGCPGGAIDVGEDALTAAKREVKEEVGLDVDPAFAPVFVGGYQKSRSRNNRINDNYHAFVLRASSTDLRLDPTEVSQAHWFPVSGLLEAWRAVPDKQGAHAPARMASVPMTVRGLEGHFDARMLAWLEVFVGGRGLPVAAVPSAGQAMVICMEGGATMTFK